MPQTISLRISSLVWRHPERFAELLEMLQQEAPAITEVAFFTAFTHPPLPLATIRELAMQLKEEALPAARKLGLRAGINHLATIGHLDENPENSLAEPWQHLVDLDGSTSASCYCAADPRMAAYIREVYATLAGTAPDFIWIDDDVRLESHARSIRLACFCPFCLENFARESGRTWTREALREAFSNDPREERLVIRRQWQAHTKAYIANVLALVREVVDSVNPAMPLGFMTGEIGYSGYDDGPWTTVLSGKNNLPVMRRPGGGFYTDDRPLDLLGKVHAVGRQLARYPETITDIQYEHENFPYQVLRKSRALFIAEIAAAIGAGCTGVALNMMGIAHDPLEEYRPLLTAVEQHAEFLLEAAETFGRSPSRGIWPAFTPFRFSAENAGGNWEDAAAWGGGFQQFNELFEIGLPPAYGPDGAALHILTATACDDFSLDELRDMLAGGVLLDGGALERLHELGLGELTGFRVRGRKDRDSIEQLTGDPLNGTFAGWHRDCRPSFWPEPVYLLEPIAEGTRTIAEIIDFTPVNHGPTAGIYENALGGRVGILGYYPWHMLQNLAISNRMKALCRWLSRNELSAYVSSFHKAALWHRTDADGYPALLVLNASIDPVENVEIAIRTNGEPVKSARADGLITVLPPEDIDATPYHIYQIPEIGPWEARVLTVLKP